MKKAAAQFTLTGLLGEIQQIVGLQAALQIAAAAGGRRKYVPLPGNLTPDHWLVKAIGIERARKVAHHFSAGTGGMHILVPLGPTGSRAAQWAAMRNALAEGSTANQIAGALGLHERTTRRHRSGQSGAGAGADPRQRALFDRD